MKVYENPMYVKKISGEEALQYSSFLPYAIINEDRMVGTPMCLWDTLDFPTTGDAIREFHFFQRKQGEGGIQIFDTNNPNNGEVLLSQAYLIESIHAVLLTHGDEPFADSGFGAIVEAIKRAVLQFLIDDRPEYKIPLHRLVTLPSPVNFNQESQFALDQKYLPAPLYLRPAVKFDGLVSFEGAGITLEETSVSSLSLQLIIEGMMFEPFGKA